MITKSKPAGTKTYPSGMMPWLSKPRTRSVSVGSDTITYGEGPSKRDGHCIWKPCWHDYGNQIVIGKPVEYSTKIGTYANQPGWLVPSVPSPSYLSLSGHLQPTIESTYDKIWQQLDLNCNDSVMLYSGILQAVPLVGGCFKFVSIMNNLGRKLAKGLRNQPFTTVVKSAISADFINRFVLRPTLDDAAKFISAHNYVVNVMNTAYERNSQLPTSYEMTSSDMTTERTAQTRTVSEGSGGFGSVTLKGVRERKAGYETKVFVLASASYNTSAIDPVKLWATRLGVNRPLDSAWDLVPFSFVVDYFTRAGDFISSIGDRLSDQDALRGRIQKVYGCWSTETKQQTDTFTVSSATCDSSYNYLISSPEGSTYGWKKGAFVRSPFNPLSAPTESPSGFFRLDLSSVRVRTLGELYLQMKVLK